MRAPRINKTIQRVCMLSILISTAAIGGAAIARADGYLSEEEQTFGNAVSSELCIYLDQNGVTFDSMYDLTKIIYENTSRRVDVSDSVDIVNYVVYEYCPRHWASLVAFGEGIRA